MSAENIVWVIWRKLGTDNMEIGRAYLSQGRALEDYRLLEQVSGATGKWHIAKVPMIGPAMTSDAVEKPKRKYVRKPPAPAGVTATVSGDGPAASDTTNWTPERIAASISDDELPGFLRRKQEAAE